MDEKMEICQGMGPKREKIFHFSFKMRKFRENWMKEESRKNEKKESSKVTKKQSMTQKMAAESPKVAF